MILFKAFFGDPKSSAGLSNTQIPREMSAAPSVLHNT